MSEIPEIPGYEILEEIGRGSTAVVWRARQQSLNRDVAIKVMYPHLWQNMDEADAFLAEAHSVALLKSRHVIQVYDVGKLEDTAYIVLEFADGITLTEYLKEHGGRLPSNEALQIISAIADALGDAWSTRGMIHRDIKPDNIIIEHDGSVKLADLGLAKKIDPYGEESDSYEVAGTPNYMSPEQVAADRELTPASDMYSLGAMLYQMLTGRIPFGDLSMEEVLEAQLHKQLPWPQDLNSKIPLSCCQFVTRLLMKDPEDRYSSWSAVYSDTTKLTQGRMLMIKIAANAMSSVARAGQVPTGHTPARPVPKRNSKTAPQKKVVKVNQKKVVRLKNTSGQQSATAAAGYQKEKPVPEWLTHICGWSRFAAMFILIWLFIGKPLLDSTIAMQLPISPERQVIPQNTTNETAQNPMSQTAQPTDANNPFLQEEDTGYDTQNQTTYDETPMVSETIADEPGLATTLAEDAAAEPPLTPVDHEMPIKQELLRMLVKQDYDAALQHWQDNANQILDQNAHRLIATILAPNNRPYTLMGNVLSIMKSRPVEITVAGKKRTLQIDKIEGDIVKAMVRKENTQANVLVPYEFKLSHLPPAEQMRLLERSRTTYTDYARGFTALQNADFQQALTSAANMGPLEDAMRQYAKVKIERLTQP